MRSQTLFTLGLALALAGCGGDLQRLGSRDGQLAIGPLPGNLSAQQSLRNGSCIIIRDPIDNGLLLPFAIDGTQETVGIVGDFNGYPCPLAASTLGRVMPVVHADRVAGDSIAVSGRQGRWQGRSFTCNTITRTCSGATE